MGGVDLVGQSSLSLTLYDLYRRWFFFVSSGFCDFDKWVFGGWLMVAQLNGYVNFIDGSLVEWDGGWVIVWLNGGGWVVG